MITFDDAFKYIKSELDHVRKLHESWYDRALSALDEDNTDVHDRCMAVVDYYKSQCDILQKCIIDLDKMDADRGLPFPEVVETH